MKGKTTHNVFRTGTQVELARANARLSGDLLTIASRVSHDLRTPLGGIVNTGELLREILLEKEPSSAVLADSLFISVDDMTKLIGQIRLITRATASPQEKKRVKTGEIVSDVLQRLESRILKKAAVVVKSDAWPEASGVAEWLETIWWNFLVNALQHGGEKLRIELKWRREKSGFHFDVCDNGPGVPAEMRAQLFQTFDSLHRADGGRGLGLSIVRRLVDLQGGECGYEPVSGGGARFFFTLPAA